MSKKFWFELVRRRQVRAIGLIGFVLRKNQNIWQRKNQNIVRAIGLIGSVLRNMNDMRENGWDPLFEEVKSFCTKMNIVIPNMDDTIPTRGRSRCRGAKLVSYYHHFHNGISIVVIDQVLLKFNNRFPERSTQLLGCIACLDPRDSFANFILEKLIELSKFLWC
jgi:hypothetical protein